MRLRLFGILVAIIVAACASPGAATSGPSAAGPDATIATSAAPAPSAADGSPAAGGASVVLPPECVAGITTFLVTIEPMVSGIDFETATPEQLEALPEELAEASEAFNPEVCPDIDVASARAAWIEIAQRVAPGTVGYVEYTYD